METKTCGKCHETKPLREFHKARDKPDGYRDHCKSCRSEAGSEKRKARNAAYYVPKPKCACEFREFAGERILIRECGRCFRARVKPKTLDETEEYSYMDLMDQIFEDGNDE